MIFNTIAEALGHPDFLYNNVTEKECDAITTHYKQIGYSGAIYVGLDTPVVALASKLMVPPATYVKPVPPPAPVPPVPGAPMAPAVPPIV